MCRTVHAVLQSLICAIQMMVRIFITMILMLENLIRMIMQTFYNFISFMLQMVSLLPICVVFLVTSRLKCFMCGGGGPCQIKSGGSCDCAMSAVAVIIIFLILKATGLLDKIFYRLGYAKAKPLPYTRFMPTPGDITECSRNDSDIESTTDYMDSTEMTTDVTETAFLTTLITDSPETTLSMTTESSDTTVQTTLFLKLVEVTSNWTTETAAYYLS